ncbi:MAG: terpene cyclase/mutase family protein [Actinobacteria bacterium]|nr:terpene cyclase/mutase family protein [Actinomycetota bacterium]
MTLTANIGPAQAGATTTTAKTASPATTGLFGEGDPTYDGVFRQSLSILGLIANDVKPNKAAITWLLKQQCANGGFQAYRPDTTKACDVSDPVTYTGPDTNSTALALAALSALKQSASAGSAAAWLAKQQNKDGGWPYYSGSPSDSNSTGLTLAAVKALKLSGSASAIARAGRYLTSVKLSCASGGGLAFQKPGAANALSTAQAFTGLSAGLIVGGAQTLNANPTCGATTASNAGSYLANAIMKDGALPNSFGAGNDFSSTAFAILGFVSSATGKQAVTRGTATLAANASAFGIPKGEASDYY